MLYLSKNVCIYSNNSHFLYKVIKKNKSEQALQIIGHVVAEFYVNKCSMHRRREFVVSNTTL
jgi:hypothetical protein